MAAMPLPDRIKSLVTGRAVGYPFGTPELWVGAAVVLLVLAVGESTLHDGGEKADALLPVALATIAPVAFVNRLPRLASAICVIAVVAQQSDSNTPTLVSCVVALALVLCAAAFRLHVAYSVVFALPFLVNAATPYNGDDAGARSFLVFVVAVAALGFGLLLRSHGTVIEERDASVAAHAVTLREQSLLAERTRIARELHDVVAHHISAIAVQAETARFTSPGLSEDGAERFAAIGDSARAALDEMRGLLGVMRAPIGEANRAPQPGVGQLHDLIDEHRELGGDVRFSVRGEVAGLPEAVELVAYRVVQEGLTNARRHAVGAAVDASIDYTPAVVRVTVRDHGPGASTAQDGAADAAGFGLVGMRERVEAIGGTLTVGGHPEGGFEIVADLPVGAP